MRVLLIEPDRDYVEMVSSVLATERWEVKPVDDHGEAIELVQQGRFDLGILDSQVGASGDPSLCTTLRRASQLPLLVLVAPSDEGHVVRCLDDGADQYVPKPFGPKQLKAVIRALVRRAAMVRGRQTEPEEIIGGDLRLSLVRREVAVGDRKVVLAPREFSLLHTLLANRGFPLTRSQIATNAWGPEFDGADREVDVYIRRLRRKIESDPARPSMVLTERGYGYRFRR